MPQFSRLRMVAVLVVTAVIVGNVATAARSAEREIWAGSGPGATILSDGAPTVAELQYDTTQPLGAKPKWTLSTTAMSSGPRTIPYRYVGFHAFFQVTVGLTFYVQRGETVTQQVLVADGPANCCTPPSGGFDYAGTVAADLQAGDIFGFEMTGSNFDSNRSFRGDLALGWPALSATAPDVVADAAMSAQVPVTVAVAARPAPAFGPVTVTGTLPDGSSLVDDPAGDGWDCGPSSATTVDCTYRSPALLGRIAPGSTVPTVTLHVRSSGDRDVHIPLTVATKTAVDTRVTPLLRFVTRGYRGISTDGGSFNAGGSQFYGTAGAKAPDGPTVAPSTRILSAPVVGGASTTGGYWMVTGDGEVIAVGSATFRGDLRSTRLRDAISGIAASGGGYYLVAEDGGVFAFGVPFLGSLPERKVRPNAPIVGIEADPDGTGYWLVGADGGVYAFDAPFLGSLGGLRLQQPIAGMAPTIDGAGYRLVARDGGVFSFAAAFAGSLPASNVTPAAPIIGIVSDIGAGYWAFGADGGVFAFGTAPFYGSMVGAPRNGPLVDAMLPDR